MGDVPLDSGIVAQVQALVCDSLQVVSYKWLSRFFSVSSNAAKRVLQEFAEQNQGDKIEVVYVVSGWSKSDPRTYSVQLVPQAKLQEAKQVLDGTPSYHVYSVQPCLPKDPAQLFTAELVQAQELFMQPPDVDNCLRDNRFSSVSYSLVTRSVGQRKSTLIRESSIPPSTSIPIPGLSTSAKPPTDSKAPQTEAQQHGSIFAPKPAPSTATGGVAVKKEDSVRDSFVKEETAGKSSTTSGVAAKGAGDNVGAGKKKMGSAGGGSLANLWGKAPPKTKTSPSKSSEPAKPTVIAGDAEAGIRAMENSGGESSSDDDAADFARIRRGKLKKNQSRKRQIVFDEEDEMSEEEEDVEEVDTESVVNLASPEPPKATPNLKTKETVLDTKPQNASSGPINIEVDEEKGVSEVELPANSSRLQTDVILSTPEHSGEPVEHLSGVKREGNSGPGVEASNVGPSGPKRKKVLKTRLDDRGREVTEVVWETDGVEEVPEAKPTPSAAPAAPAVAESTLAAQRPAVPAKAATVPPKPSTKAPSKLAGKGAPKGQGNIMSFFKKKT